MQLPALRMMRFSEFDVTTSLTLHKIRLNFHFRIFDHRLDFRSFRMGIDAVIEVLFFWLYADPSFILSFYCAEFWIFCSILLNTY